MTFRTVRFSISSEPCVTELESEPRACRCSPSSPLSCSRSSITILDLDGAQIHYLDEGSGDTRPAAPRQPGLVVPLPQDHRRPARQSSAASRPTTPATDSPASAPPGYGYTPREHSAVLERFVDALELRDLTMMVQDWGGPIGLGLAGRRPELVRSTDHRQHVRVAERPSSGVRAFSAIMGGPVGRTLTDALQFVPRFFFWRGFAQPLAPGVRDAYMAPWRDRSRRLPATIGPHQLVAAVRLPARGRVRPATVGDRPALIVWGAKDFAFDSSNRARSRPRSRSHQTIVYPTPRTSSRRTSATDRRRVQAVPRPRFSIGLRGEGFMRLSNYPRFRCHDFRGFLAAAGFGMALTMRRRPWR